VKFRLEQAGASWSKLEQAKVSKSIAATAVDVIDKGLARSTRSTRLLQTPTVRTLQGTTQWWGLWTLKKLLSRWCLSALPMMHRQMNAYFAPCPRQGQ
jgi:hypothetical protein